MAAGGPRTTDGVDYTQRLIREETAWWKRLLIDRQAPYRWNLRRLEPGFVLDIGCGLGRNLGHLDGNGVGVDHNAESVAVARQRGFEAFTPDAFLSSPQAIEGRFDSILYSHVFEHLPLDVAAESLRDYLKFVKPKGKVIIITPQENGQASDQSHVTFMDHATVEGVFKRVGVTMTQAFSFPFPRPFGKVFRYNEFVSVGVR